MITAVDGIRVGHWTDAVARTGCTVALFPEGTVASGEVRGGAPAEREMALLDPSRTVNRIDALVLAGGSAFGLSAADGVMRFCEERGMGFPTAGGAVPIVVALGLYDLAVGDGSVRPSADKGYAACVAARADDVQLGRVGAGAGATIAKWQGRDHARPGGLGGAVVRHGSLVVAALVAVNAYGDILGPGDDPLRVPAPPIETAEAAFANTTIGVIATNAALTKGECLLVAQSGHDGMSRALSPTHSTADGDALVAAATGLVEAEVEPVRSMAAVAIEQAIRSAPVP
ncbi:MAG TPA: P1 family peptidase [Acidimicrobiales bacterium]|nr:P1 family peptidase [Acidimicrobiales bacterium]